MFATKDAVGVTLDSALIVAYRDDTWVVEEERLVGAAASGPWVVTVAATKSVKCYKLADSAHVATGLVPRRPNAVAMAPGAALVACGADLFALKLPDLASCTFCLGHSSSVITGVACCGDFVATCDRNEKVRISRWPQCAVIEAYCLGHSAFVTRCAFLEAGLAASCGGDGTVRLWDASGDERARADIDSAVCTCLAARRDAVAVGFAKANEVRVYDDELFVGSVLVVPSPAIDVVFVEDALLVLVNDDELVLEFRRQSAARYASESSPSPVATRLVTCARDHHYRAPASALHALETGQEGDDDDAQPAILRKHTLDVKFDASTLGSPTCRPRLEKKKKKKEQEEAPANPQSSEEHN